jgi:predicted site-specific integrase-resolvase
MSKKFSKPSADDLVRAGEACALLDICEGTLHAWVRRGLLSRLKLGPRRTRYRRSEIERILTRGLQ